MPHYDFPDLNLVTRAFMIQELDYDVGAGRAIPNGLTEVGRISFVPLVEHELAHSNGSIDSLAHQFEQHDRLQNGVSARQLAEAVFFQYYARAISRRAMARGDLWVEAYAAKPPGDGQPAGQVNALLDPVLLLQELRGATTAVGAHAKMSVRLVDVEDPGPSANPPAWPRGTSPWTHASRFIARNGDSDA